MVAFGIAWASILAMPYAILSVALPPERVGVYMGIFNFFIVLPQTVYALGMSPVIKYVFHDNADRHAGSGRRLLPDRRRSGDPGRGDAAGERPGAGGRVKHATDLQAEEKGPLFDLLFPGLNRGRGNTDFGP